MTRGSPAGEGTVKCVVWDIDNTLLTGIYLEAGDQPPGADPVLTTVLAELGERGILHALASKNPPEAAAHTARVTGWRFAVAECGWGRKSDALARIAATLGIGVGPAAGMTEDWFRGLLAAGDCDVATVRLRDAFGDDGLVGACVVIREAGIWTVPLLMMSCRAMGRGVVDALLAWLVRQAARA